MVSCGVVHCGNTLNLHWLLILVVVVVVVAAAERRRFVLAPSYALLVPLLHCVHHGYLGVVVVGSLQWEKYLLAIVDATSTHLSRNKTYTCIYTLTNGDTL